MTSEIRRDNYPTDKSELYPILQSELRALVGEERRVTPNLANAAALLWQGLTGINWAGFYLVSEEELMLGPFQGKPACVSIPIGQGVCGTAVQQNKTQRIDDVHLFPGHIACDDASNSEIVIPLRHEGIVVGVMDIDSPLFARFDASDQEGLEEIARILEQACKWS